ncbi:hypothetical protein [Saccharibacter floricola]|nr:hypothetical protein [Saccharibacter floricola]
MTRPTRYLVRMGLFLVVILGLAYALHPMLIHAFMANPGLDGTIIAILLIGVAWNLHLTFRLFPEVRWIECLQQNRSGLSLPPAPRLLAPMARIITARREHNAHLSLSSQTTSSLLDSLEARMDEGREISRYITQLLVFLGLLGTFYGLLLTVRSIADVIGGMPSGGSDLTAMFDHVKTGLVQPLGGMSTAFSGSMFGLAGALVLGFLDLTTGQAQTRFFNDIEEWFAGITRVDGSPSRPSVSLSDPAELASLSETMETWLPRVQDFMRLTTENVSLLQQNISMLRKNAHDAEESRAAVLSALKELTKAVREQRYNDPATPQILQQIERELTGLRSDLHHERSLSRED